MGLPKFVLRQNFLIWSKLGQFLPNNQIDCIKDRAVLCLIFSLIFQCLLNYYKHIQTLHPYLFYFVLIEPHFLQFKEFELYWGAVFFYDSKRSIGEVLFIMTRRGVLEKSFFNQFYWSEFWSGKWNAWKNLEWFWGWTKVKSGAKREWFLFTPLFLREREIDVWKNFF